MNAVQRTKADPNRSRREDELVAQIEQQSERIAALEDALQRIVDWGNAYPIDVFPQPDADYYRRAHEVLIANGMTLDRIAAASMRHVVAGAARIAKGALEHD